VCHHPSVSLNREKVSREISENKIAICEKTQDLRSGNFSDLNSASSKVLVPVKIFQFQDMHYENRFLGTFQGHSKRPTTQVDLFLQKHNKKIFILLFCTYTVISKMSILMQKCVTIYSNIRTTHKYCNILQMISKSLKLAI
jgi:hypothetical protein